MESKILELQKMVSKYTTTWSQIQEQMNEFTLVHVARWKGKDGKRYASPFKTKDSAEKKAKELRSQGNSEVSVTQDTLRGNIKWAKDGGPDIKGMQKEESDHEVSMARGELEAIADKATQLAGALQGKSDEGNPLEAWVQSKITKAKDYINSVSDYLTYDPSMKQNEETLEEKFALYALRDFTDTRAPGGMRKKGDRASGPMTYTQAISKAKQMNAGSSIGGSKDVEVRPFKEDLNEKTYGWTLVSKAKDIAKKFKDNITKAVAEIEKLERGLSKNPTVDAELRKYNENLEEKYTVVITKKDGSTMELGRYNTPAEAQ